MTQFFLTIFVQDQTKTFLKGNSNIKISINNPNLKYIRHNFQVSSFTKYCNILLIKKCLCLKKWCFLNPYLECFLCFSPLIIIKVVIVLFELCNLFISIVFLKHLQIDILLCNNFIYCYCKYCIGVIYNTL